MILIDNFCNSCCVNEHVQIKSIIMQNISVLYSFNYYYNNFLSRAAEVSSAQTANSKHIYKGVVRSVREPSGRGLSWMVGR
jgi:hypothetical protein